MVMLRERLSYTFFFLSATKKVDPVSVLCLTQTWTVQPSELIAPDLRSGNEGKRTILLMAEDLRDMLSENKNFEPYQARDQYETIRNGLRLSVDDAERHLPEIDFGTSRGYMAMRAEVMVKVERMVGYMRSIVEPEKQAESDISEIGPVNVL